jgi:tRNA(Ile)-lysidine synthase
VADELSADVIATGHTRDDQAETFLLRLVRGAGARGLGGIHPKTGRIVRPLIDITRDELQGYLTSIDQPSCEDETNRDLSIPRNRVRHELLPYLRREFSPAITDVLARESAIARQEDDRLQQEAIEIADLIVLTSVGPSGGPPGSVRLQPDNSEGNQGEARVEVDASTLAALHPALASRVARLALAVLAPDRFVGFEHVERLLGLARAADHRGAVSLPGQYVVRRGDRLIFTRQPFRAFSNSFHVSLSIPGEVVLEQQGWAVSATGASHVLPEKVPGTPFVKSARHLSAVVQASRVTLPLAVRSRRQGDRVRPFGMGGRERKLQDILVDRKVERETRDSLPLVVDGADRIVWIVGETVAEDFRVTDPSQGVIFLKARRLGGQG